MITGLGMTETAPFALCANGELGGAGAVGLPAPGVEVKLVRGGRQARGALPRAQRDAGLLARARADARSLR